MAEKKQQRFFKLGERVVVKKKTHLVDREREHEGIPKDVTPEAIDENVTGIEGEVESGSYASPSKGGEVYVPIRVGNGGIISVPEGRLERTQNTPSAKREPVERGRSSVSREDLAFWRKYFRQEEELKRLKKTKKG